MTDDDGDNDGRGSARPLVSLLVVVSGALGISLQQLSAGTPATTASWVLLIVGSCIGGAAGILATGLFERLLAWAGFGWAFLRRRTRMRTVVVAATACALAVAAGLVIPVAYETLHRYLYGCPQPAAVRVMTSVEQLAAARRVAGAYEVATAEQHHGCPTADLYVYGAGPTESRAAVASGWLNDALQRIGPRADVWLPDSTLDVSAAVAASARFGVAVPIAEQRSIAYSPIVLAAPTALPGDQQWRQLWAEIGRLGWDVVRPDPAVSSAGVLATAALYASLGAPVAAARDVEQRLEAALDRGRYPLGTSQDLLCHGGTAAVITTEQAVVRYNQGLGCGPPERPLLVQYPNDTISEDHPFVRLAWDGVAATTTAAAAGFGAWLGSDDGRRELVRAGLRPTGLFAVGDPLTEQFGAHAGAVFDRRAPQPKAVEDALRLYERAHRPGRVLLALDASGSMQAGVDRAGTTRFQLASRGVTGALDLMSDRDEFGLRIFPADGRGAGTRELLPIGPAAGRKQAAADAMAAVRPAGGTPLLQAILDGARDVGASPGDRIASLVVLTDGNDTSGRSPSEVDAQVRGRGVRVFVVAIGEASCGTLALRDVTAHTGGGCYDAGLDTLDDVLVALFGLLWGGDTG
ncbi:substrate-binding domain-containing protein [Dactylosporangium siamense]|uniref:VWA domain-containing protein n=1 Tax=Dactylosporangium siamense TaxID=685454 RepID=A0A919PDK5_9ACTN|nr:substrate-binding domain-containing protein [Dactylosporangium siamense]GIG42825.1 VWA domain-containing protein [Dactylosporangium siamense]